MQNQAKLSENLHISRPMDHSLNIGFQMKQKSSTLAVLEGQ